MDSKDQSVFSDKTNVISEPQALDNVENKDNTESCVEKVSEENEGSCITSDVPHLDKGSDEPQPAETEAEISEKINNETNEETNHVTNEETNNKTSIEINKETNKSSEEISKEANKEINKGGNKEINTEANEETNNETNKEAAVAESEKDLTPLNIETSDSAVCLETLEDNTNNDNAEVTMPSSEKNSETVISEENNLIETSSKESISINANKETSKLSTQNLTEKCDVERLSNCEDLLEVPDNPESKCVKSVNENVATELETSVEKNKYCDNSDEINTNTNDEQVSQKEIESSKKAESESSDSNLENLEKDSSEKNIELERTEFVQFSHDKNDDTQIENQSIEAEDPFGGDNLASENVEPMETDSFVDDVEEVSFKGLYDRGDNLQDAVSAINAKSNNCNEKLSVDCESSSEPKIADNVTKTSENAETIDSLEITPMETDPSGSTSEIRRENTSSAKSSDEQNKTTEKNIEEITPMETDEEQTNVLPGQDDELCIIPDSMKVIMPDKSGKAVDNEQSKSVLDKDSEHNETTSKSNSELSKDISQDSPSLTATENKDNNAENTVTIQNEHTLTTKALTPPTDVINIDDESKKDESEEVEEIITKETCKQCGEERTCKIRVKIGTQNYHVCSKTCKALFKAANNKAVDIPSDGSSSKQERRCASCISIIDVNEERNVSWETMEFCNEDCLGKFQRKYGSYCKNCNGMVQSVSLGKYCVRFGCDVRQFCCSTCLEEFKKGLKVCSYCQKDISSSSDGFLAPVGDKGQFKDFCTQDCMEKYSKLNSSEPMSTEKKPCSVCKEVL